MIACCYYTNDAYKTLADRAVSSAEFIGLRAKSYFMQNPSGTWRAGDSLKPAAVLEAIKDNPDESVLFVDADCRFIHYPMVLHEQNHDHDVAAYFHGSNYPSSTVLWFRKGSGLKYAEEWVRQMDSHPNLPNDAVALSAAFGAIRPKRILHLPPAYCWTEYQMRRLFGAVRPVIEHYAVGEHKFPTFSWEKSPSTIYR
jgi:hypothetical protein